MSESILQDPNRRRQAWDGIEDLVREAHRNAVEHGFYAQHQKNAEVLRLSGEDIVDGYVRDFKLSQLAKIGEECGEACHALRKGLDEEFLVELADICIRVFDLAGFTAPPDQFAQALLAKMEKNIWRERLHGRLC